MSSALDANQTTAWSIVIIRRGEAESWERAEKPICLPGAAGWMQSIRRIGLLP